MKLTPQEAKTLKIYDMTAEEWSVVHNTAGFWKKEMNMFKELLANGRILEIGSGGGRDAKELIALGYEYVGTDISSALLAIAQRENLDSSFLLQSVYDLNFSEVFDGFWTSAMLLHVPKSRIDEALQSIRNVVRDGGIGFISIKQGEGERVEEDKRFFAYYSKEEFTRILLRNNFTIVETGVHPMSEKTIWLYFFIKVKK